jgi:guanylate kinase
VSILLYVLIGESGSGKTTVQSRMIEEGFKKVVTYTTRPKRPVEINHVDYHFVNEKEFKFELLDKKVLIEHAIYNDWHYGFTLEGINYHNEDYVIILTPQGYATLRKKIGEKDIMSIYIRTSERERLIRLAKRGDNIDEIMRRIIADRQDFKGVETVVDMVIEDADVSDVIRKILISANRSERHGRKQEG